jgi:hypothetical protein
MHQQPQSTGLSMKSSAPWLVDAVQLWAEEEDKEESKRIGKLKEQQREKQRLIEEEINRRRREQGLPPLGTSLR